MCSSLLKPVWMVPAPPTVSLLPRRPATSQPVWPDKQKMTQCRPKQTPPRIINSRCPSSCLRRGQNRICRNRPRRRATPAAPLSSQRPPLSRTSVWHLSASQVTDIFKLSQNCFGVDDQCESRQHRNNPANQFRCAPVVFVVQKRPRAEAERQQNRRRHKHN